METGIYTITAPSGNFYIGSTTRSFKRRWAEHRSDLRHGRHRNSALQAAWNKYGEAKMQFAALVRCAPEECAAREQHALATLPHSYNLALHTDAPFKGRKHSDEAREKCRNIRLGKKFGPLSEERRQQISAVHKGRKRPPFSAQWREKIRAANLGKTMSAESRAAISKATRGRKRTFTQSHREALGRWASRRTGAANPAARRVVCVETGAVFATREAATQWIRSTSRPTASGGNISSCCAGRLKSAYGYHWKYADAK